MGDSIFAGGLFLLLKTRQPAILLPSLKDWFKSAGFFLLLHERRARLRKQCMNRVARKLEDNGSADVAPWESDTLADANRYAMASSRGNLCE